MPLCVYLHVEEREVNKVCIWTYLCIWTHHCKVYTRYWINAGIKFYKQLNR